MADTPKHSVSVAGIVVDHQDRVLVIKRRDNGRWEPPGGVLELDEGPEEGVRREVHEETGLTVVVERASGIYKNMSRGIVSLVFRCRVSGGTAGPTEESTEVSWLTLREIEDAMPPAYSVRVSDAFLPNMHVRMHDGVDLIETVSASHTVARTNFK